MSLSPTATPSVSTADFTAGLSILFVAQLLSAFMGIYTEQTYAAHGKHWREVLFYSHFFGIFFSAVLWPSLKAQWFGLVGTRHGATSSSGLPASLLQPQVGYLLANAATQVVCISGVNLLSARTSAVMVTVVLNVRKLVSFLLSCVIFGNPISGLMAIGATIVFTAGAVYGWDESRQKTKRVEPAAKVEGNGVNKDL